MIDTTDPGSGGTRPSASSFEGFYRDRYEPMRRLAFLVTGSRQVAEELVQDCFARIHGRWDDLTSPDHYLRAAVIHACRSQQRRWILERDRSLPALTTDVELEVVELRASLMRLPYRQRAAIVLRFYVGIDDVEIATLLGCQRATVRSLVQRGLASLREELDHES